MKPTSTSRTTGQPRRFRPGVETLEDRRSPTDTVLGSVAWSLAITGGWPGLEPLPIPDLGDTHAAVQVPSAVPDSLEADLALAWPFFPGPAAQTAPDQEFSANRSSSTTIPDSPAANLGVGTPDLQTMGSTGVIDPGLSTNGNDGAIGFNFLSAGIDLGSGQPINPPGGGTATDPPTCSPLAAPTRLTAQVELSPLGVHLHWTFTGVARSFSLERLQARPAQETWIVIPSPGYDGTHTSYDTVDRTVDYDRDYRYRVKAVSGLCSSDYSALAEVTTPPRT